MKKTREKTYVDVNCVTCGLMINEKTALRHMEKCYLKLEMKSYYGTSQKVTGELESILCNYYNSTTGLYCRHLKIICPEHNNKDKISSNQICGFPLNDNENIFKYSKEICRASKKECSLHFNWDKIKLASLDIQKLNIVINF